MDLYQLERSGHEKNCSVILLMQSFEGRKTVVFFGTSRKHKVRNSRSKSIVSQLICFQSNAWTLLLEASPHPCAFFSSHVFFPTPLSPNHANCLRNWRAITSICCRSWLKYSGRVISVLRSFVSSRWRANRGAPRFRRRWTLAKQVAATYYIYLGSPADQTIWKVTGLEQMIHVVKDSAKPAGAKFGAFLDFPGLTSQPPTLEELHCYASDAKPGHCQLWELVWSAEGDKTVWSTRTGPRIAAPKNIL